MLYLVKIRNKITKYVLNQLRKYVRKIDFVSELMPLVIVDAEDAGILAGLKFIEKIEVDQTCKLNGVKVLPAIDFTILNGKL